jgi:hypothetical protein
MLDDKPNDPLFSLENFTLGEVISILQNYACDLIINTNKEGFGSYSINHIIKEKLDRYHKESMVPTKIGDVWEPRIYVTIGKIFWPAILDLGSSVLAIPKYLFECDVYLKLSNCSIKHALDRVNNVLVELHMTFVHVDFIIMDMDGKNHIPIGRTFLKTTCSIIDAKEGNVKLKFPHKKCMEHYPRKKEGPKNCPHGYKKRFTGGNPVILVLFFCSFLWGVCVFESN